MADKSISQLSPGVAVTDTDLLPNVQVVGVGPVKTTAVQIKTYVNTNPNVTGVIKAQLGSAAAPSYTFDGDLNTGWWSPAADTLAASTGGSSRLRIDSTGNVGVGTTNPLTRLHAAIAGTGATNVFTIENSVSPINVNDTASISFRHNAAGFAGSANIASILTGSSNVALAFATYNGSLLGERMRIEGSGNVGIGTTSPNTRLDVRGDISVSNNAAPGSGEVFRIGVGASTSQMAMTLGGSQAFLYGAVFSQSFGQFAVRDGYNNAFPAYSFLNDTNTGISNGNGTADTLTFITNGFERMRINSAGNIGLSATPSAWSGVGPGVLEINGSAYIASTSQVLSLVANAYYDGTNWIYKTSAAANRYETVFGENRWFVGASGTANNPITFTQAMTLTAAGNLAIGATSTVRTLRVARAGGFAAEISLTGSGNSESLEFYIAQDAASNAYLWNRSNNIMAFGTNNNERMRIAPSGEVGIGNITPRALLHVGTTTTTTDLPIPAGNFVLVRNGSYANPQTAGIQLSGGYGDAGRVGAWQIKASGAGGGANFVNDLIFSTQNSFSGSETDRMRIDSFGNLGLGVTPAAWGSTRALQIGTGLSPSVSYVNGFDAAQNAYNDGISWKYILTGYNAGRYTIFGTASGNSSHAWFISGTGTAGAAITFTQAMTLDASGNLMVGSTTARGRLHVKQSADNNVSGLAVTRSANDNQYGIFANYSGATFISGVDAVGAGNNSIIFNRSSDGSSFTESMRIDNNGNLTIGTGAVATNATNGFLYVTSCAGTPTGTPTTHAGRVPIVVDTTNNKLYFYSGGAWRDAGP